MQPSTPVRVAAIFEPGKKAKPVWFELNNRQHKIKETTYFWTDRVGDAPLLHYAVIAEDSGDLYELVFDTVDLSWFLHAPS